ncbi:MAG: hypothetical protein QXM96_04345 [Candidatus Woesearchaeota archaeon]
MICLNYYVYKNLDKFTLEQILMVFASKMIYAGYQGHQIMKEKNKTNENE